MKKKRVSQVALVTLLAPIAWGTTYVTVTELLPDGRPLLVAWSRLLPAGLVLVAIARWRAAPWPGRAQWRQLVLLSACNFGLFFPLLIVAVYRLPGGVAASIGGVQPLLVGFITWVVTGQVMRRREVVVGVAAAIGVAMVVVRPGASVDQIGRAHV